MIADYTVERNDTNTGTFAVDPVTGAVAAFPEEIVDDTRNNGTEAGAYIQDEWKILPTVTINYGVRLDEFAASFDNEGQVSPCVQRGLEGHPADDGARGVFAVFRAPPVQYVPPGTIAKFANTTNAPANTLDDPPVAERSNYYDVGISQQITKGWQVNVDGFYKAAKNLIDEGQFGDAVIFTPFNYRHGEVIGSEFSTTYKMGGWSAFANFAWTVDHGQDIDSQQFTIDPDELAYIQTHYIPLDHQSIYTASGGISYQWKNNQVYLDMLYASGLRSGFANSEGEPGYYPVSIGYVHAFALSRRELVKVRFDILNLFDDNYQIRSGTGIGVAAPQYGQRRTFYVGLAYEF